MALIEDEPVIEKILRHLYLWEPRPSSQAPSTEDIDWSSNSHTTQGALWAYFSAPEGFAHQGWCESNSNDLCPLTGHRLKIQACLIIALRL